MRQNGATLLVHTLLAAGVKHLFTLSGNQVMSIYDACLDCGMNMIHVRHEGAAAFMADAWGRLTEEPGVALVTAGPGHTNALTPLFVAAAAESPMILLSGHCPISHIGRRAFQEMAQAEIAQPLVKAAWTARDPEALGQDLAQAFRLAKEGRPGPVHLSLPADVLDGEVRDVQGATPRADAFQAVEALLPDHLMDDTLGLFSRARNPLIIAGPAMSRSTQWSEVARLSEITRIPAVPMASPRGVRDPQLGEVSNRFPDADLALLLGKRLDFSLRYGDAFGSGCRIIQIDPSPSRDHKQVVLAIPGDPKTAVGQLRERAASDHWPDREPWTQSLQQALAGGRENWAEWESSDRVPMHPLRLLSELRASLNESPLYVCDGGEFGQWAQAVLSPEVINGPSGTIGGAVPAALAAKVAHPGRPVIALTGDGAFGFHAMEFDTALRYTLPIIVIIGNDAAWNAEKQIQIRRFGAERTFACDLLPSRYDKMVEALGGHGEFVESPAEIAPAIDRALGSGKPACVNVRIQSVPAP